MNTDEQAKIAALKFNGYRLDAKHTFSACTFPDFHKIMEIKEPEAEEGKDDSASYLELRTHLLATKED